MKKILCLMLAVLMIASLTACTGNTEGETKDLEKITLCLDWTPNTNHTGFYVAQQQGYYKDAGIELTIVQPAESSAATMCATNQAQFAIEAQDTLAANFVIDEPLEITAVGTLLNHNTSGIMSRKGEGLDRPKGMENKVYATWDSPIELAMLKHLVEKDGGDWAKVEENLIPNTITDEANALKEKQTDSVWVFYGWAGINAELNNVDVDFFDFASYDSVFDYYTPIIISNNKFLEENPDTAKAFMEATAKGYEYAIENPEDAAKMLIEGDTTGALADSEELVTASQKWISEQYVADGDKWGYIEADRWNGFYKWLWDNKLIEKEIPKDFGFTNDYLS